VGLGSNLARRNGVDAALEADGAGVDGAGVDVVEDVAGGVVVAGAGVAFGEPGLVEADLAYVVGIVVGQGAGEQGFGGGGLAELDVAAGGHDVDLGTVEPVHPFGFADSGAALVVGVVDGIQGAAAGVRVVAAGGGPGEAFQQQRPCDRGRGGGAGDGSLRDEQAIFTFADVGDLVGEARRQKPYTFRHCAERIFAAARGFNPLPYRSTERP